MPFLKQEEVEVAGVNPGMDDNAAIEARIEPLFFDEVLPAAYKMENTVGSGMSFLGSPSLLPANPYSQTVPQEEFENAIRGYEMYASSFIDAETYSDFTRIKKKIDGEERRKRILNDAGWYGFGAAALVTIADPINLIPSSIAFKAATKAGRLAKGTATTAIAGGISASAAEAALQATQETRTYEESAANVAAATILSGILGLGAGYIGELTRIRGNKNTDEAMRAIEKEISNDLSSATHYSDGNLAVVDGPRSTGAAQVETTTLEQETLKGALGLEKALEWQDPILRTSSSPSIESRRTIQNLAEVPLATKKTDEGIANPIAVESLIKRYQYNLAKGLVQTDDLFVQYRKGRERKAGDIPAIGLTDTVTKGAGKLTRPQFYEAVGKAMRRGDKSDIPEVEQAAKIIRKEVFDPAKKEAIDAGLLDENVDVATADSYLMRVYNQEVIAARRPEFEEKITDYFAKEQAKIRKAEKARTEKITGEEAVAKRLETEVPAAQKAADKSKEDYWAARTKQQEAKTPFTEAKERVKSLQAKLKEAEGKGDQAQVAAITKQISEENQIVDRLRAEFEELTLQRRDAHRQYLSVKKQLSDIKNDLKTAKKSIKSLQAKIDDDRIFASMDRQELQAIATEITDKILGNQSGRGFYQPFQLTRGPLKERTLGIRDEAIEDFLESNIEHVARVYTRTMAPDIELTKRFGDTEMNSVLDKINDDYARLRAAAGNDSKKLRKLNDLQKRDIEDIKAVRDRLRGTYGMPTTGTGLAAYRAARVVKTLNYMRLLGGMTLSALPDLGRAVMIHGFTKSFSYGLKPLFKNIKAARLSMEEVKMSGTALDMIFDTRAMAIADIMDDFGRMSKFERGIEAASSKFGLVSLMAPWNAALKQFVGIVSQTRTLKAVSQLVDGTISQSDKSRLARMGISESLADRINDQFRLYGREIDDTLWANTSEWTDPEAVIAYQAALSREVDKAIITPGQEKPLWLSTPLGSVIGQFKSFGLSSTQRVLLSGLQQRDKDIAIGMLAMVSLGMLSTKIKNFLADRENGDNLGWWLKEGIDRSGVTGWLFDAHNMIEKSTRGAVGLSQFTDGPMMSRYQSRNVTDALIGPTAGFVEDFARGVGSATNGEWSEADTRAVRRLLPYQNVFYLRGLFDALEEGANEATGAKQ